MKLIQTGFIALLFVILSAYLFVNIAYSAKLQLSLPYSPPLGHLLPNSYGPYPFTKFGYQNPDLLNIDTCFLDAAGVSIKWPNLFHAGTDWFELNGNSAAGDPVTAIADGVIVWISVGAVYPGEVVIIKHTDPDLGTLYSVYMHLDYSIQVQIGDTVNRGDQIAVVIANTITLADGTSFDNSHLHWEVRTFADATTQAWFPQSCDGSVAGEGYTKADPVQYGYIDPDDILNGIIFMPLIRYDLTPTPTATPTITPTPTKTPTPTPTATPTPIPCVAGVNLVKNGDFEDVSRWPLWVADTPNLINPYFAGSEDYRLLMGHENSADQTVYQTVTVPSNVKSVDIQFLLYIETLEFLPFITFDYLYVDVVGGSGAVMGASLLHEPFAPYTNKSPLNQWTQQTLHVDDIEFINTPIRLQFHATTTWAFATDFSVDNVQLITRCQ